MSRHPAAIILAAWAATSFALAQDVPGADASIQLPATSVPDTPLAPLPSTGPLPEIGTLTRDMVAPDGQAQNWNIGLRTLDLAPHDRIAMGASFSEPGILRITGEEAQVALAMGLPPGAAPPPSFRLILRSSVNDLPERSSVAVVVNGQEAGTWPLSNIGEWGQIDVPGTALKEGVNTISLTMRQHHRIFCGPEASFGVWTEIDLPQSGVTLPANAVPMNVATFRSGLLNIVQRGQPIDIRTWDDVTSDSLATVVGAMRGALPEGGKVRVSSPYAPVDGKGRRVGVSLRPGTGAVASVAFVRSPQGALVMQVTDGPGLTELMATTFPPLPPTPDSTELTPGTVTSFKDLGAPMIVHNTRYASTEVPFTLPQDWMNLSSQRALLTLDYGFAADLPEGSILLVKANGVTIVLLPLDVDGGRVLPPLPIRFPANLLRGGDNALTFEMIVPGDPSTLECPVRTTDMLVVLNSSSLNVPPTPPMTFGGLAEELRGIGPGEVSLAGTDTSFLQTFIGQMAMAGGGGGDARLDVLRMPQDFAGLGDDLPMTREQIAHLFKTEDRAPAQDTETPQFFQLSQQQDAPVTTDGSTPTDPDPGLSVTARLQSLVHPEGEDLAQWLVNRSADTVLMAPAEGEETWTLVADSNALSSVLATSFDTFRDMEAAQGARVALRAPDGSWQTWPPHPRPHVTGPVSFRQSFQVIGNYASWAPGYYAIILVVLALLSTIPAFIYVISTRREKNS